MSETFETGSILYYDSNQNLKKIIVWKQIINDSQSYIGHVSYKMLIL